MSGASADRNRILPWARLGARVTALLLVAIGSAGCTIFGFAAHAAGPPAVEPQYVFPQVPVVVVVKDVPDPTGMMFDSEEIADRIEHQFKMYDIAPLVPAVKVTTLQTSRPAEAATMSPARLGREVGADQVLLVQVQSNTVAVDGARDMLKGQIAVTVSVIDSASGATLWPDDGGTSVAHSTRMLRMSEGVTPATIRQELIAAVADKVVKLFRKYKPD